jgi:hypothetical protein
LNHHWTFKRLIDGNENELSDEGEDSDSNSKLDHEQHDETKNTRAVLNLTTQVNGWRWFEGPQS